MNPAFAQAIDLVSVGELDASPHVTCGVWPHLLIGSVLVFDGLAFGEQASSPREPGLPSRRATKSLPSMENSEDRIVRLLEGQGFRELVSAHLFAAGVPLAPTMDDKHMLAEHAREELGHFEIVATLYEQLSGRALFEVAARRAAELPLPATWLESAVAGYLVDRAASTQLGEYVRLDDARLAPVFRDIHEHEHEHQAAAETALLDQSRRGPGVVTAMTPHVVRWYQIALSVLDGPAGADRDRVEAAFAASVRGTLAECGVAVPGGSGTNA